MATQFLTNPQITKDWQLAATGPATVILSTTNGSSVFFVNSVNVKPTSNDGHPIPEGDAITFDVKTGEFLFVLVSGNAKTTVTT